MDEINNFAMEYLTGKAVDTFGEITQLDQAVEEFAEFTVAVNHYKRKRDQSDRELLEETCDCIILAKQLEHIASEKYGQAFDDAMSYKLSKLDKAIRAVESKEKEVKAIENDTEIVSGKTK